MITKVFIVCAIILLLVLALSIFTMNKGYAYKHSITSKKDNPYFKHYHRKHINNRMEESQ